MVIERADEIGFMSTPDSSDVTGGNALADAIVDKDDPRRMALIVFSIAFTVHERGVTCQVRKYL